MRFEKKLALAMLQKQQEIEQTLAAAESEANDEQAREECAKAYASEIERLGKSQMEERAALASKLEAMRRQFDDLQKEKLDGLLEAEQSAADQAKGMLNDLTKEDEDVAAKVKVMQKEEQSKLRARLEAKQRAQVQSLMEEIERI